MHQSISGSNDGIGWKGVGGTMRLSRQIRSGYNREQGDKDDAYWSWEQDLPELSLAKLHLEYFVANLVRKFERKMVDGKKVDLSEGQEFHCRHEESASSSINSKKKLLRMWWHCMFLFESMFHLYEQWGWLCILINTLYYLFMHFS